MLHQYGRRCHAHAQALLIKTAVEEPETDSDRAILLIERARDSKAPATRAQDLTQALQKLATLPAVQPPNPTGTPAAEVPAEVTAEVYAEVTAEAAAELTAKHIAQVTNEAAKMPHAVYVECPSMNVQPLTGLM